MAYVRLADFLLGSPPPPPATAAGAVMPRSTIRSLMSQPPPAPDFSGGDHLQAWQLPQRAPAPIANTIAGLSPMTGLARGLLNPQRTANQIASLPTMMQEDQRRYVDQLRDPSHQTDYTVGRMPDRVNQALSQLPSLIAPELAVRGSSMLERDASPLWERAFRGMRSEHVPDAPRIGAGKSQYEFWTANPDLASSYATEMAGDAPNVIPGQVDTSKFLDVDANGASWDNIPPSAVPDRNIRQAISPLNPDRDSAARLTTSQLSRMAEENGYHGVAYRNLTDHYFGAVDPSITRPSDVFSVIKPEARRSAFPGSLLADSDPAADPMFQPGGLPQRAPLGPPQGMRGSQMPEIGQGGLWRDAPFGQQQFPERSWGLDAPPSATSTTPQPAGPLSIQRGPNQNGADYFVARDQGGNFVGHTSVARDGSNLYPDDMMVLPQFRRQGVMTQIMTEAERQLGQDLQRPRIATPDGRGFRRSYFDTLQGQRNSAADLPQLPQAPDVGGEGFRLHVAQDDAGNWHVADQTGERQSDHIFSNQQGAQRALENMQAGRRETESGPIANPPTPLLFHGRGQTNNDAAYWPLKPSQHEGMIFLSPDSGLASDWATRHSPFGEGGAVYPARVRGQGISQSEWSDERAKVRAGNPNLRSDADIAKEAGRQLRERGITHVQFAQDVHPASMNRIDANQVGVFSADDLVSPHEQPHAPAAGGEPSPQTPAPAPQHNPFWRWSDLTGGGGEDAPVSLDPPRSEAAWTAPLGQDAKGRGLPLRAVDGYRPPQRDSVNVGLHELNRPLWWDAARFGSKSRVDPRAFLTGSAGAAMATGVGLANVARYDPTLAYSQPPKTAQQIRQEAYMAAALAQEQAGLSGLSGLSNTPYRPGGGVQNLPQRRFTRPGSR